MRKTLAAYLSVSFLIAAVIFSAASCRDSRAPTGLAKLPNGGISKFQDLCWPPGPDYQEMEMSVDQTHAVYTQISQMNYLSSDDCSQIQVQANSDLQSGQFRYWYAGNGGDPRIDPNSNTYGDRHTHPEENPPVEVSHLTPIAFANECELQKTAIHETAHHLWPSKSDLEVTDYEDECLGYCNG